MHALSHHYRSADSARRRTRSGIVTGTLLVGLVMIIGLVALAYNVGLVVETHRELRTTCEAAALAAAAELLDEGVLTGQQDESDDIQAAKLTAQRMAGENRAAGQPVMLDLNPKNLPGGDIVVGWVNEPEQLGDRLYPWDGQGSANTVQVTAARAANRGNPLALWAGNLLGVTQANVRCQARASIDQHIYGFRPGPGTTVPVVLLGASRQEWYQQALTTASSENDQYTVNVPYRQVTAGGDGIPEIELRAAISGTEGSNDFTPTIVRLMLSRESDDLSLAQQQLARGLGPADLVGLGGQFSLFENNQLKLPSEQTFDPQWVEALWAIDGQTHVWPLGEEGDWVFTVQDFGAAVLVNVELDSTVSPPQLVVRLQPTVLATSTALADADAPRNPWIAKLMLTQ